MKKHYKVKKVNITKLKTYLKDAIRIFNKRSSTSDRVQQHNTEHNNLH